MSARLEKQLAKLLKKARGLSKKGNLAKALDSYRKACETAPHDPEAWLERAQVAEVLSLAEEAADSLLVAAEIYARAGMQTEAAGLIIRLRRLVPDHDGAAQFAQALRAYMPTGAVPPKLPVEHDVAGDQSETTGSRSVPDVVSDVPMGSDATDDDYAEISAERGHDDYPEISTERGDDDSGEVLIEIDAEPPPVEELSDEDMLSMAGVLAPGSGEALDSLPGIPDAVTESFLGVDINLEEATSTDLDGEGEPPAAEQEGAADDIGPVPGNLVDGWKAQAATTGEHPISQMSARLAVADIFPDGPPESPKKLDLALVDAVAEVLPVSPLLSELDSDLVKYLTENSKLLRKSEGEPICQQGDVGAELYLILSGDVVIEADDGRVIATLRPGAFFGEMALLTDAPRSATVRAATDGAILEIPRDTLRHIVDRQAKVRKLLMRFFRARMVGSLLISSDLFNPLSVEDRRRLVTRFRLRELSPEQVVLEQGTRSDGLYLVLAGEVEFFVLGDDEQPVVLDGLGPSGVFGEVSLLRREEAAISVRAKGRAWVLRLPSEDFSDLIENYPAVHERIEKISAARHARDLELLERK